MNKQEFTDQLATKAEFSKAEAGRVVDAILETVTESLAERDEVSLPGFGKFVAQRRRGREGSDPRNPDKKIRIPPAYVPKFRAGTALRRAVEGSAGDDDGNGQSATGAGAGRAPDSSGQDQPSGQDRRDGRRETAVRADATEPESTQPESTQPESTQPGAETEGEQSPAVSPRPAVASRGTGGGWKPLSQR